MCKCETVCSGVGLAGYNLFNLWEPNTTVEPTMYTTHTPALVFMQRSCCSTQSTHSPECISNPQSQNKHTHYIHSAHALTTTFTGVSGYEYAYTLSTLFIYTYQVFPQQILSYPTFLYPLLLKHWGRMVYIYLASFTSLHLRLIALIPLEPSPSKTKTEITKIMSTRD